MTTTEAFAEFWIVVRRNEEYLKMYGQHEIPQWEDLKHDDLVEVYGNVQKHLSPVCSERMFDGPGGEDRFYAQNYHEALVEVLNPPERWFRQLWMLNSPEYIALKKGAKDDEDRLLNRTQPLQIDDPQSQKKKRSYRKKNKDELFGKKAMLVLHWLIQHHGNSSGNPSSTPVTESELADRMTREGTEISQPTVSRAFKQLMGEVDQYPKLRGATKYTELCDGGEICDALNQLTFKSNRYLDRLVADVREHSVGNVDQYHDRGY
ncbi:MAG: hypothetical protein R3C18_07190 [Planctomycetaceae bacterium]